MGLYLFVFLLCILSSIAFYDRKWLVWSVPIIFLLSEISTILYHLIGGMPLNVIFTGEASFFTVLFYPVLFLVSGICSLTAVMLKNYRKKFKH